MLKPKPATDMCDVFADKFNLKYEEIMIVGTKEVLKDADYIIKDIGEIPMLLDSLN